MNTSPTVEITSVHPPPTAETTPGHLTQLRLPLVTSRVYKYWATHVVSSVCR